MRKLGGINRLSERIERYKFFTHTNNKFKFLPYYRATKNVEEDNLSDRLRAINIGRNRNSGIDNPENNQINVASNIDFVVK